MTFVVQDVLSEGQHGGKHAADAQAQHTAGYEQKHMAGVEDQEQELDQDDAHLTHTHTHVPMRGCVSELSSTQSEVSVQIQTESVNTEYSQKRNV